MRDKGGHSGITQLQFQKVDCLYPPPIPQPPPDTRELPREYWPEPLPLLRPATSTLAGRNPKRCDLPRIGEERRDKLPCRSSYTHPKSGTRRCAKVHSPPSPGQPIRQLPRRNRSRLPRRKINLRHLVGVHAAHVCRLPIRPHHHRLRIRTHINTPNHLHRL